MLNSIENNVPVLAFEAKTCKFVGEFDSMAKAARILFIKKAYSIIVNIHSKNPYGIKSYKTGIKYNFQLKKKN